MIKLKKMWIVLPQDFESIPRLMRMQDKRIRFIFRDCISNSNPYEIPPGIYEVSVFNNNSDIVRKENVSSKFTTMTSQLRTSTVLEFSETTFLKQHYILDQNGISNLILIILVDKKLNELQELKRFEM